MKLKLTPKLTLIFVLFAALLLVVVNLLGYGVGKSALERAALAELEATAGEKQAALDAWLAEGRDDMVALAADPVTLEVASALVTKRSNAVPISSLHNKLLEEFTPRVSSGEFLEVMLIDPETARVLVATDPREEVKSRSDRPYFLEGKLDAYISTIYFSEELRAPAITASAPIMSKDGKLVGVLAGRLNLEALNEIIQRRSGLHQTDDSFLVNTSHQFVTQPRFQPNPMVLQQGAQSEAVNRCLEQKSGRVFADDYRSVPVIAVYRWLPQSQLCLIVNISQAEALAEQHSFGINIGLISLMALLTASLVALVLSRAIVFPILNLQKAAQSYSQGDLTIRLPESRYDELGALARQFNTMATALAEKEKQLREHSLELENRVTERTTELQNSQKRFQALIENAPDGIALLGLDGKLRQVTPSTLQILGYTLEDAQGQDPTLLTHPDDLPGLLVVLNDLIQNPGKVTRAEYRFRHKDGSWRWLESTISNLTQEAGVEAIVFNYRDITERKNAEETLQEKGRLLSEAQMIGQIGSLSYDIPGDAFQFSDEMYHLLDVLPEKFQHNSKDFLALVYPSDRPEATAWIMDLREGRTAKALDFRIFRQNGELRYLHCKGALEFNSEGKPTRFIGTTQDVTERKLAEIQINQQLKHLTALSEIDRAIISGLDQRQILDVILSQTLSQLQVDAADILLLDSDGEGLRYAAGGGFHTLLMEKIYIRLAESYAGRVAKERRLFQTTSLRDQVNDPLFDILITNEGFVSYAGVPLIIKKEVKGVLEVYHRTAFQPYQEWLDFLNTLAGQAAIAIENTNLVGNLKTTNQELSQAYEATIDGWSHALDLRDRETEGHSQRVTELTLKVARAMGVSEAQLVHIRRGALLHDIGKLGIPDRILMKADQLTPDEWETMQKHPEYAYEMLSPIQYLKPALPIPYFHHEKWDGTGYPLGLRGQQIPLEARIFAVVDVWDALLSDRPYRKAWTKELALEHIRSLAGSHFDPTVVDYFMQIMKF